MPFFDLKTNVKDVPAEFHKETTDLIANLLGKPNSVSVQTFGLILERGKRKPNESSYFGYFQALRAKLNYFSGTFDGLHGDRF